MNELALIFQTEPGQATPRLKPRPGSLVPWGEEELRELETTLARQYPDLIRGKVDTVIFQDRPLRVVVQKNGDNSRMPAVLLTDGQTVQRPSLQGTTSGWLESMLADFDRLGSQGSSLGIDPLEQTMLRYAAEELRSLAGRIGGVRFRDC